MTELDCNLATVIKELQDAVSASKIPARTIVSRVAPLTVPYGIEVLPAIGFDTVIDDNVSGFSSAEPTRVVIKKDGIYNLCANISWKNSTQSQCAAAIFLNGQIVARSLSGNYNLDGMGLGNIGNSCSICYPIKSGDYIELKGWQFSSNSSTILNTSLINLSVVRLGDL